MSQNSGRAMLCAAHDNMSPATSPGAYGGRISSNPRAFILRTALSGMSPKNITGKNGHRARIFSPRPRCVPEITTTCGFEDSISFSNDFGCIRSVSADNFGTDGSRWAYSSSDRQHASLNFATPGESSVNTEYVSSSFSMLPTSWVKTLYTAAVVR